MSGNDALLLVIEALDAMGLDYVVVGSYASNSYGVERATRDADLVVEFADASPAELFRRLRPAIRFDPQMSFETVTMTRRFVASVEGTPFEIELFQLGDDPHDQERFRRRRGIETEGRRMYILTAEDVIVTKLRWARPKDREDVGRDRRPGRRDRVGLRLQVGRPARHTRAPRRDPPLDPAHLRVIRRRASGTGRDCRGGRGARRRLPIRAAPRGSRGNRRARRGA